MKMNQITLVLPLFLASCGGSSVNFATSTLFGLETEISPQKTQSLKFGYQRVEGVRMPTKVFSDDGKTVHMRKQAYSVLSLFDFKSNPFDLTTLGNRSVKQVFATGDAANVPNAGQAVGNTMLDLKKIPTSTVDAPPVADDKEAIFDALNSDEFSGIALAAVIDILQLPADTGLSVAEIKLESATPEQLRNIRSRIGN